MAQPIAHVLQEQYNSLVDALVNYYNGPLAGAFWETQFHIDIDDAFHTDNDNQGLATSLFVSSFC